MELLLRTNELRISKGVYTAYKPVGSIVTARPQRRIRRLWMQWIARWESHRNFRYAAQARAVWRPAYLDIYNAMREVIELGKPTPAEWEAAVDRAWAAFMADGRVLAAFPNDPRGDVHATEAGIWTARERQHFLVIKADEAGFDRTQKERLVLQEEYRDSVSGEPLAGPRRRVDWENALGMSGGTLAQIRDRNFAFDPRLNRVVPANLVSEVVHG